MILLYQSFYLVVSSYFDLYKDGQNFRGLRPRLKTEDEVTDIYKLTNYILMG
jgi:hypothetical protein